LGRLIQADYQTFLGRQAAPTEVVAWQAQLQAGLGENQLQAAILASAEFFGKQGNAITPWLNRIYVDVLGRAVDSAGLAFWTQSLQAGASRGAVALAIVTSPEAFGRLVDAAYRDLFGHVPDPQGRSFWVTQLEHGLTPSQFLASIASSQEFIALQGGIDVSTPAPIVPVPIDTFLFTPFIGPPLISGCICVTTAGFTGGDFTGGGFTGGGFTGGGFTGGGSSGGST
jgi:hypothetical protein